ncbi:MAG TPA: hypothetical protein VHI11_04725, partial [Jiangellaceae bacterium]|nr:hypothetical protein [Jiangellaceae bacterium]
DYSEEVAGQVDEEVRRLIETAHQEAFDILVENRDVLDSLVTALLERETLNKEEVAEVFSPVRKRERRPAWTGSATRKPSERGPVEAPAKPEAIEAPSGNGAPRALAPVDEATVPRTANRDDRS